MQQLMFLAPGRVEWQDHPAPALKGQGDALVRPLAVASCDLDAAIAQGRFPADGPFALGHEFVGVITDVGADVRAFAPGDVVAVPFQISCGRCSRCVRGLTASCVAVPPRSMYGLGPLGGDWGGALSDLVRVPFANHMLVRVPDEVEPAHAASVGDNVADAWRAVVPPLGRYPMSDVLIIGGGGATSIGLYAVDLAVAHGARSVRYVDHDDERLRVASSLGAETVRIDGDRDGPSFPYRIDPAQVTVDASATAEGLALALRSTEPGGTCTNVGVAFELLTPVPLLEMYATGVTLVVGRAHARPPMPQLLALMGRNRIHPDAVTTEVVAWHEAADAMTAPPTKVVIAR